MNRSQLLNQVRELLVKAGFYVSDIFSLRPVGFDLIARRDNTLLIIKVLTNINAFTEEVSEELKKLTSLLNGRPLLIGIHAGNRFIEDEVVYDRFGIQAINAETLRIHLLEGIPLHIYAAPGGYYARIDSEKLKEIRHKRNISLGSFAKSVHVSRRTVRMYEDGMNARVDVAYRIEDLLNESIIQTIDIMRHTSKKQATKPHSSSINASPIDNYKQFQKQIFSILKNAGYVIIPIGRCPFEAVSKDQEELLLTCVQRYDDKIQHKAKIISSISKITEKRAVMITDKKGLKDNIEGTPLIIEKELRNLAHPSEVLELILERLCS